MPRIIIYLRDLKEPEKSAVAYWLKEARPELAPTIDSEDRDILIGELDITKVEVV